MAKKKRRRKRVYQEKVITIGFVIEARFGSVASKMKELDLPIIMPVDERGLLGTRAAAEKEFKKLSKHDGVMLRELTKKTSKLHGSRYGKSQLQRGK